MRCARCDRRLSEGDRFCGRCGLARSTDGKPVDPLIGITVAGRYRIERRIGVGGMGTVYLGTHVRIGQQVAVKVLHERYADDDQLTKRFEKEALTYGQVTHPNLVGLHDYGRTDDGTFFMVLEYCPGISLAQLVRRQGRLDAALAADILIQIAQGLGAAHAMGIVHRDLKPENVILTRIRPGRYHARLLDFGIAKRLDDDGPRLTAAGMVFGTPEYMAPEQARGKAVDARSDVYALGCVAYELLTGNPPFTGNDKLRIMHQQAGDPPPAIAVDPTAGPPVPTALRDVTMRCLEKKPGDRYADTEAFIMALERALGRATAPAPDPTTERPMTDLGIGPTPPEASPAASTSRELGTLPQASPAGAEFGGFGSGEIESLPTDLGVRPSRPGPPARMLGAAAGVFVGVVAFSAWLFSAGEPAPTLAPTAERASVVKTAAPEVNEAAEAQAAEPQRLAAEATAAEREAEKRAADKAAVAQAKAAEEKRIAAEKAAAAKAAAEKREAEKRLAAEKAAAAKAAAEKLEAEKRLAAEKAAKAAEEKRIAEEKAAEAKRIAAEKAAKAAREAAIADARKALRMGQLDDVEKLLAGIEADAPEAKQLTATLGTIRGALDQGRTAFEDADCVGTLQALEPVLDVAPGTRGVSHMVNSCRNSLPPRQL